MRAARILYALGVAMLRTLPAEACLRAAERLAECQWRASRRDRQAVETNLRVILGTDDGRSKGLAREVFTNFGRYLVEFFTAHAARELQVTIEGFDHLRALSRARGGGIILTAHLGNWELGAVILRRLGFRVCVVALPHRDPWVNGLFDEQRRRCGVEIIPLGPEATRQGLQALRSGALLGLVGDREFGDQGIAVSLFGQTVAMPRGPALLSLRTGVPVVPVFLTRERPWRFRLAVEPPIAPTMSRAAEPEKADVQALTERYRDVMARYIRQFPSQWLMLQPLTAQAARP